MPRKFTWKYLAFFFLVQNSFANVELKEAQEHLKVLGTENKFSCSKRIGEGNYGFVFYCVEVRPARASAKHPFEFAMKVVELFTEDGFLAHTTAREIAILRSARGAKNILQLKNMYFMGRYAYLALDYYPDTAFGLRGKDLAQEKLEKWTGGLLTGLMELHEGLFAAHLDIKPQNVLISDETAVLADFGLTQEIHPGGTLPHSGQSISIQGGIENRVNSVGGDFGLSPRSSFPGISGFDEVVTLWYRSPELLLGNLEVSAQLDYWSLGCMLSEIWTGKPLFPGKDPYEQIDLIFQKFGTPRAPAAGREGRYPSLAKLPYFTPLQASRVYNRNVTISSFGIDKGKPISAKMVNLIASLLNMEPAKRNRGNEIAKFLADAQEHGDSHGKFHGESHSESHSESKDAGDGQSDPESNIQTEDDFVSKKARQWLSVEESSSNWPNSTSFSLEARAQAVDLVHRLSKGFRSKRVILSSAVLLMNRYLVAYPDTKDSQMNGVALAAFALASAQEAESLAWSDLERLAQEKPSRGIPQENLTTRGYADLVQNMVSNIAPNYPNPALPLTILTNHFFYHKLSLEEFDLASIFLEVFLLRAPLVLASPEMVDGVLSLAREVLTANPNSQTYLNLSTRDVTLQQMLQILSEEFLPLGGIHSRIVADFLLSKPRLADLVAKYLSEHPTEETKREEPRPANLSSFQGTIQGTISAFFETL